MKVSAKAEYACIAVLELSSRFGTGKPVRIRRIAERHDVPPRFLVQILLQLKGAGLVASTRGAAGGYQLIRPPEQVTLGDVLDVVDGSSKSEGPGCAASPDSPAVKALLRAWREVTAKEQEMLHQITFAQLLEHAREEDEQMYYI